MKVWTDTEDATLRAQWAKGVSASQIALALGTGRSRNAIIGRAHRLELKDHALLRHRHRDRAVPAAVLAPRRQRKPVERKGGPKLRALERIVAHTLPAEPYVELPPLVASVADLESHHCRWIPGEPTGGLCGRHKLPGLPYCEHHAKRAFRPVEMQQPHRVRDIRIIPGTALATVFAADVHNLQAVEELTTA